MQHGQHRQDEPFASRCEALARRNPMIVAFVAAVLPLAALSLSLRADDLPVVAPRPLRTLQFDHLTPGLRQAIDAQALACPADSPLQKDGPFFGGMAAWIVSRAPLSMEQEVRRAEQAVAELAKRLAIAEAPAAASDVLHVLVAELPERFRAPPLEFSLGVVDVPQWVAFTPGGGRLFISKPYLDALLADPQLGRARLAFVLAHEMGHIARQHTRRGYQLVALEDAAREEAVSEVERARLRRLVAAGVRRIGDWIAFLYSKEQDYEADLFAIHLCRNAGFDLEGSLDVPRLWAMHDQRTDAGEPLLQSLIEHQRATPPLYRIKRLREELDGALTGDTYGLLQFDPQQEAFVPTAERSLPERRRGVVFIHGMGSHLERFVPLAELLDECDADDELVLFGFQYPGDASLARVGRALTRELAAFGDDAERLDFVCHSAGGLVFRWYAERESGRFRQAVFLGTPHGGSDLAAVREFLEVQQFVGDLRFGFREAIENVANDGDGQIGYDLQPDSLFLRNLGRGQPDTERYAIFRGRRYEGQRVALLRSAAGTLRSALRRVAPDTVRIGPLMDETDRWIGKLRVPDELARGDLAVTLQNATLDGVTRVETVRASHYKLQRHPEVMDGVATIVLSDAVPSAE